MEWEHSATRHWYGAKDGYTYYVIQDEKTYEYLLSVHKKEGEEVICVFRKEGFKTKGKAIKAAENWTPEVATIFDKVCGPDCECPKCSEEVDEEVNVKITTTKTTRKEKLEEQDGTKSDLKLALWYIEKIGGTKRAKQVLNAACKAMDEIK